MDDPAISQFMSVTGSDEPTANFFLQAANGNCDAAVSAFFESGGMVPPSRDVRRPRPERPTPAPAPAPAPAPTPSASTRPAAAGARRGASSSGFATLDSLRGSAQNDEDEQGYYAGGEKSGQMIQPRKEDTADQPTNLADAIFERARARGPRTDEERAQFEGHQSFTGAGYRLGDSQTQQQGTVRPDVVGRRNVTRVLTFYANGFQVDEGPLRSFDDPANEAFLEDVNRGVVPREMEESGVGDVSITLVDKKGETFVEKKKKVVPFSGGGMKLNGGAQSSSAAAPIGNVDAAGAAAAVTVDESRPVAVIQIRLSDGTRLTARLNEDHTVGDLRQFVTASRPSVTSFTLSTTFPRKILDDDSKTIKEEQLKGAVVMQTLK
eukprot:TRINITY_DN187_c0_g1_i10.p1 TRINITY_DN187_c0_g1~~TRINITY_DN187_c0_g1_i10.p1  ORF type:complete len:427 (+),score=85.04 TRINITY_DN187_c0_g1_i10:146-1282(+)